MQPVVTAFLRNRGEVLLVRRSDAVGTYRGKWGGVSGYVETEDPLADAYREIHEETGIETREETGIETREETGIETRADDSHGTGTAETPRTDAGALSFVRRGAPLTVEDEEGSFTVHPFLFDCDTREVALNEELTDHEWTAPTAISDHEAVPKLWETYRAVAPTVETVTTDTTHGSAYISLRALEVLRDEAAVADDWGTVASLARQLRDARPEMAAVSNRVNRVMVESAHRPTAVHDRAVQAVTTAASADERAAEHAATLLDGPVLTLSRSGTVTETLAQTVEDVFVAESRPGEEGRGVAARLAETHDVTLVPDAGVAAVLADREISAVVVGSDTVHPDGRVRNKLGTRAAALAADFEGLPVYVVTGRDKIAPAKGGPGEGGPDEDGVEITHERETYREPQAEFDVPEGCDSFSPLFDTTPASVVSVVTEDGRLDAPGVEAVARDHADLAEWE
jgi:translation initiation factor 2B subunit (eIF-2B alpha/beta/delta family)